MTPFRNAGLAFVASLMMSSVALAAEPHVEVASTKGCG